MEFGSMGLYHQPWSFLLHIICFLLVFLARPNSCDMGELQLGTPDVFHHISCCLRILAVARKAYVCTARRRLHLIFVTACREAWLNEIKIHSMAGPSHLLNER